MTGRDARLDAIEARLKRLEELEAKEAIRDGLYRYARAVDRCDMELLRSCYHPGARDVHWSFNGDAMEFCAHVIPDMKKFRMVRHTITNPMIDLHGDRAFVESFFWCVLVCDMDGGLGGEYVETFSYGRYLDIWECRDGQWKIADRRLAIDSRSVRLITDQPAWEPVPGRDGVNGREDPVYLGFDIAKLPIPPNPKFAFADACRANFQAQVTARRANAA